MEYTPFWVSGMTNPEGEKTFQKGCMKQPGGAGSNSPKGFTDVWAS